MARPEKNNVDYFPFLCKEGKAVFYIETKFGNDGYASWVKMLRELAVTDFHFLDLSDQTKWMYLSAKCKVSEDVLESIINDLCLLGEFDKILWHEFKIIWSDKFVFNVTEAYKKRNNECINRESLLHHLDGLGIRKPGKGKTNTKVEGTKIPIPELKTFLDHCKGTFPDKYSALEFSFKAKYESWKLAGWKDGHGKKIKNWKNKVNSVVPYLKEFKPNSTPAGNQSDLIPRG